MRPEICETMVSINFAVLASDMRAEALAPLGPCMKYQLMHYHPKSGECIVQLPRGVSTQDAVVAPDGFFYLALHKDVLKFH